MIDLCDLYSPIEEPKLVFIKENGNHENLYKDICDQIFRKNYIVIYKNSMNEIIYKRVNIDKNQIEGDKNQIEGYI
jgi:hypothetical protein